MTSFRSVSFLLGYTPAKSRLSISLVRALIVWNSWKSNTRVAFRSTDDRNVRITLVDLGRDRMKWLRATESSQMMLKLNLWSAAARKGFWVAATLTGSSTSCSIYFFTPRCDMHRMKQKPKWGVGRIGWISKASASSRLSRDVRWCQLTSPIEALTTPSRKPRLDTQESVTHTTRWWRGGTVWK